MLKKVDEYIKQGISWYFSLFDKRKVISSDRLCNLSFSAKEINFVYASRRTGALDFQLYQTIPYESEANSLQLTLSALVTHYQLAHAQCIWTLQPEQYQLLSLESLPVTANEFQAAIRWKIKDMLHFPIEDAVIDSFPIPLQKTQAAKQMIMVVVARKSYLQDIVKKIQSCGLELTTITIPELGLLNIAAFHEEDERSAAIIYLEAESSQIIITRQHTLYLSRRFDFGLNSLLDKNEEDTNAVLDKLVLQIQRSFDYYQGQWRTSLPAKLYWSAVTWPAADFSSYLSERLMVPIEMLDISMRLSRTRELNTKQQGKYLSLVGGLLQEEIMAHAATN